MSETIYTWTFSSKKHRWNSWYIIAFSIVIWLVIWWFLTKQYGMSFIILLISWLWLFIENNSEDEIVVKINDLWIKAWESFYDFSRINSYSFIYSWDKAIFLRLNLNKKWLRNIDLIVNNEVVSKLNNILPNFLEENPKEELTMTEKIISLLKL